MREVERFLDAYRRLEAAAPRVLPREGKGGVIARLLRLPKFAPYREELDCCREVRNLLTHEVRVEGEPAIVPGAGMVVFLEKMIDLIENPPRVKSRMTPRARLYTVTEEMPVAEVMRQMKNKGLSRVPLLDSDGTVRGIFSIDSVFSAVLDGVRVGEDTALSALARYLPLSANPMSAYRFVSPELTLDEAEAIFYHTSDHRTKTRALLVTEGGVPHSPLLGILSPYDVLSSD